MKRFDTVRDAKEYLIHRILEQADRDGAALSDVIAGCPFLKCGVAEGIRTLTKASIDHI